MVAYFQADLPPSTAPVKAAAPSRRWARPIAAVSSPFLPRLLLVVAAIAMMIVPGYFAARETESLVLGILAGDFVFLLSVAGWSAVASGGRR